MSSDQLMDIRTPLAISPNARVEVGQDGVVHVLAGPVTLHVDRSVCAELAKTMARAMQVLEDMDQRQRPRLKLTLHKNDGELK